MQNLINIMKNTALAIIVAVFATGCISEKYEVSDLQNVMIQLNVSSADEMTKATETPVASEQTINTRVSCLFLCRS